ncbi:MAG: response regulator [Syntrophorhabdaceae bacterium]|nr:response regulator [Syntrophorhabdaceae bacterium]MDD4195747.1 response regulator [Syntrophorhabdaceae bacterium]HOC47034.1 response regulator [Syntrophorhabdaceae bacterium]
MADKFKILVTDDDADILEINSTVLRGAGYEVYEASTGAGCLDMARRYFPDLILLDVVLPDMTGFEVCKRIKKDPELQGPFIILASGIQISSDSQAEGLTVGADGYMVKPWSRREFIARIQAMERIKRAEDKLFQTQKEQTMVIEELRRAIEEIKTLRGLIPICAWCKRIRDDAGYWDELEVYLSKHSEAVFSHGLCPDCSKVQQEKLKTRSVRPSRARDRRNNEHKA